MTPYGTIYRTSRERIGAFVTSGIDLNQSVPACPGWTARGVVSHLVGTAQDVIDQKLGGVPSDEHTASQVERYAAVPLDDLLRTWSALSEQLEPLIDAFEIGALATDAVSHECDLYSAFGLPLDAAVTEAMELGEDVLKGLRTSSPLVVCTGSLEHVAHDGEDPIVLSTTALEAFRWRLGRRSRPQLLEMAWSADPGSLVDELCIFGPSPVAITEVVTTPTTSS